MFQSLTGSIQTVYYFLRRHKRVLSFNPSQVRFKHIPARVFDNPYKRFNPSQVRFKLSQIIDPEVDSVIIYTLWGKWKGREVIGLNKNPVDSLI